MSAELWEAVSHAVPSLVGSSGVEKMWTEISGDTSPVNWPRTVLIHGKGRLVFWKHDMARKRPREMRESSHLGRQR